jgi:NAD-dependent deacetylase
MNELEDKIGTLRGWILESKYTVFFGGAGVSTDSGLADFRSRKSGLYHQENAFGYAPERILSHIFFEEYPAEFFDFYRTKLLKLEAKPNITHMALAELERKGLLSAVITQNADGLHQRAGSKRVLDLHGNVYNNTCLECGKHHDVTKVANCSCVPYCECGGIIRPGIVLFDEVPDMKTVMDSIRELNKCELLIIGGTSLKVSSAWKLLSSFRGRRMVIINDEPTAFDDSADLLLRCRIGNVFHRLSITND